MVKEIKENKAALVSAALAASVFTLVYLHNQKGDKVAEAIDDSQTLLKDISSSMGIFSRILNKIQEEIKR